MTLEAGRANRRLILVLLALSGLVVVMDLTIQNVALKTIQQALGASDAGLQWSMDAYLITFGALIFTGGVLADRYGRKKTLIAGLVLFGATSVLAAFSGSIGELVFWRALMGCGAALVPSISLAIIINVFPPAERPKAIAAWAGAAGVALAVGPVVGGLLLDHFWWGSVFLVSAPVILVVASMLIFLVPESKNPQSRSFDPVGVVLSIAAMGALVYGIVYGGDHSDWSSAATLGPIVGGIALTAVLVLWERRLTEPALDLTLLRGASYSAGTWSLALAFFSVLAAMFVSALYFQEAHGYSPGRAALLTVPMGVGSWVMSFRTPKLTARFGPRLVVAGGALVMALAFALFATVGAGTAPWLLVVAQLVFGLGWGSMVAPATAALMSEVPMARAAAGQAVSQTIRQVAGALGVAIAGSVIGVVYRSQLGTAADSLPAATRASVRSSLGGALNAAQSGAAGQQLIHTATDSFLVGMRLVMVILAVICVAAAAITLRWMPARLAAPKAAQAAPAGPPVAQSAVPSSTSAGPTRP